MNLNEKIGKKEIIMAIVVLVGVIAFFNRSSCSSGPAQTAQQAPVPAAAANSDWLKPEPEKEYKKSCRPLVFNEREKGVYFKEFLKKPNNFIGDRLSFDAKIMHIEEEGNKTFIQAYITRNMDSVIIEFYGTMKIYDNDIIHVWGEGDGTVEGKNRMGVDMSWPRILAKYIKKIRSDD